MTHEENKQFGKKNISKDHKKNQPIGVEGEAPTALPVEGATQAPVEDKLIEGHEYDGIRELDNNLPSWWLATFYITIVFALLYFAYYSLGEGPGLRDEFNQAKLAAEQKQAASKPKETGIDETQLANMLKDSAQIQAGKVVFDGKCASCHGNKGEGLIGPNLTDAYWIHGKGTWVDITKAVDTGVPDKGMPPWGPILKPVELQQVVVYIKSLEGTNPPNAKAPQGDKIN